MLLKQEGIMGQWRPITKQRRILKKIQKDVNNITKKILTQMQHECLWISLLTWTMPNSENISNWMKWRIYSCMTKVLIQMPKFQLIWVLWILFLRVLTGGLKEKRGKLETKEGVAHAGHLLQLPSLKLFMPLRMTWMKMSWLTFQSSNLWTVASEPIIAGLV